MGQHKEIPAYQHFKPRNIGKVALGGRVVYLRGPYDSRESHEHYCRVVAEYMANRMTPVVAEAVPTIDEILLAYWNYAEAYYRPPSTEADNVREALKPIHRLYGTTPAKDFGPIALQAVRNDMVRSGLARTTINGRVHRMRRAFRWAASQELIPSSVPDALSTVAGLKKGRTEAVESPKVDVVDLAIIEATLPHLSPTVSAMVRLQLAAGMRPGEVMAVRSGEIVRVDEVWEFRPGWHKGAWRDKDRIILFGPKAQEAVRPFLKDDPDAYVFSPRDVVAARHEARSAARKTKPTPSELARRAKMIADRWAEKYNRTTYRQAVVRACDLAFPHPEIAVIPPRRRTDEQKVELKAWQKAHRWCPLRIRHTAATYIRAKYGLEAAQVVLGHASAETTQIYANRNLDKARDIMGQFG